MSPLPLPVSVPDSTLRLEPVLDPRALSVLIADDEPLIRRSVGDFLRRRGHHVRESADASAALAAVEAESPDVVLVDWKMPGSGESVVRALLDDPEFGGRVILVTGSVDPRAGVFRHEGVLQVEKPFCYQGLVEIIEVGVDPVA